MQSTSINPLYGVFISSGHSAITILNLDSGRLSVDIECLINGHKSRWPKKSPLAVTPFAHPMTLLLSYLVKNSIYPVSVKCRFAMKYVRPDDCVPLNLTSGRQW